MRYEINPGLSRFTLKVYARDGRDEATMVGDVLARAAEMGVGR